MPRTVYTLINSESKVPFYVGVTSQKLSYRLRQHLSSKNLKTVRLLLKQSVNVEIIELEVTDTRLAAEKKWIKRFVDLGVQLDNVKL